MKKNNYIQLLYKKLNKSLGQHEKEDLANWLKASEDNQRTAKSVEQSWDLSGDYTPNIDMDFDMNADFAAVQGKIQVQNAPAKVVKIQTKRWLSIAASLTILVAVVFLINDLMNGAQNWQKIQTAAGETQNVILADGTTVLVNENSTFSYAETFADDYRLVKLEGEAFFDVHRNSKKPFVIQTDRGKVKVLGTSFSVRDFVTESSMEVHVKTGIVELQPNNSSKRMQLQAGESGTYDDKKGKMLLMQDENANAFAWMTRQLIFDNQNLQSVLKDIEKMYQVEINLLGDNMQNCPFSNTFDNKPLATVLDILSQVLTLDVEKISKSKYQLSGGICR